MKNLSKKTAKALAVSMFAVGFVTPVMFSNIAEASNFGKGGSSTAIFTDAQIENYSAKNSSCTTTDWTIWTHNIQDSNCVMINGYRFKVVGNTSTNGKQILTLWSYNSTQTGATKSFATNVKYEADGDWSDSGTITAAEAYNNSDLKTAMDGLLTIDSTTGKPNGGELYDSNLTYVKYTSTTDSNVTDAYVWAPSKTEVESTAWGDGTTALTDANRAVGNYSWMRSPYPDDDYSACIVYDDGNFDGNLVDCGHLLRPALQILNQTSYVFTTNVTIPTNGVFTADGSGTATSYALNSSAAKPTFTPTSGVTLDGTKIGITASTTDATNYKVAGLLTKATSGTDTWANLNGTTANIAYMAQASSGTLDLSGVTDTDEYTLKVFGLKTADTTVTELADNAVQGLSKGSDSKIHMKVGTDSSTGINYNENVPVTLANDAVIDLVGDASNPVTVIETGTGSGKGTLNLGEHTYSGTINNSSGTLTLIGADGTLSGTYSGTGTINIGNGDTTDDVITSTVALGAVNINSDGTLVTNAKNLDGAVTNGGTLTLTGSGADNILDQTVTGDGTINIGNNDATNDVITSNVVLGPVNINPDGTLITDAKKLDGAVTNGGVLTLTGTGDDNILDQTVTGDGTINIGNDDTTNDVITSNVVLGPVNINPDGTLITDAKKLDGAVTNAGVLTLTGTGDDNILDQAVTGTGTINIGNGDATNDVITSTVALGAVNINSDGTLITDAKKLDGAVTNAGVLTLTGTGDDNILDQAVTGTGTINIGNGDATNDVITSTVALGAVNINSDGTLITNAKNLDGAVTNGGTLTLTGSGADNILDQAVTGDGTINIGNGDTTNDVITATVALGAVNINSDGTLVTDAKNLDGAVTNGGVLTLTGTGDDNILDQTVTGDGTINIGNGDATNDVITSTVALGAVNINSDGTLITDAKNLDGAVANGGVLTLTGTGDDNILDQTVTGDGTINIGNGDATNDVITSTVALGAVNINSDGTLITDAKNLDGAVANDGVLTLTGTGDDNILDQNVTGTGTINIGNGDTTDDVITSTVALGAVNINSDGTLVTSADNLTETPTIQSGGNLQLTGGSVNIPLSIGSGSDLAVSSPLTLGASGKITQAAGSNIVIPAPLVEAGTNDASMAFFQGINNANQLDVGNGNLTVTGQVQDNKYYVLVAGTAVNDKTVSDATLWKMENISFPDILMADYEIKYDVNTLGTPGSVALHVKSAVTNEEGNTSGMAAVQQGAMTVSKEFTGEVENHLSMMTKPSLSGEMHVKVRDVASIAGDEYNIETVEQGNANEVMPVQVVEKDKYDKEIWASYIRTKETTEGMKLDKGVEGNNTAQYNGAVVGVDFYTSKKAIAGVAFSYTNGDIDSYSGTTATRNKSKYYGVSIYDRVTNGNNALIYDIGYIRGDNDISQFYTGKETTSDVKTDTYTAGVRYEAEFGTEKSRVVPFASFRYMRQNNKDYTNSHGTRFDTRNQNLYIPKVGIAWTGDFIMPKSVWTWRPSVEAGYVWNLGDRNAESNFFVGTRTGNLDYDVADKSSYYAKAGMEFMCKNFTAGLSYRYLKGSAVRNNKWNVNLSWSF